MNLQKNAEDQDFRRESIKRYTGSNIGTPSPFDKKEFIKTPKLHDDFIINSNNNTPIIRNRSNLEKNVNIEHLKEDALKQNKNFTSKNHVKSSKTNENSYSSFCYQNSNININHCDLNTNDEIIEQKMNPNINLFNFPIINATGQLNQLSSNYLSENNNNYSSILKNPQQVHSLTNNNEIKNNLFTINNSNNQPQKLIPNNIININSTININIKNNIVNSSSNIINPNKINIANTSNFPINYPKGIKFIRQNLNYAEMDKEELAKYVEILGKDQAGCRLLQKRISEDPSFSNEYLYHQMVDKMTKFMYDAFGNYLIQKILENISDDKKKEIIRIIEPEFIDLGCSPHGTRVIQKIIEVITHCKDLIHYFIQILEKNSINLMKDINGNHIIIKYVFTLSSPLNDFIYKQLVNNIVEICTHKHGCCVLQKCIEGANDKQRVSINIK